MRAFAKIFGSLADFPLDNGAIIPLDLENVGGRIDLIFLVSLCLFGSVTDKVDI